MTDHRTVKAIFDYRLRQSIIDNRFTSLVRSWRGILRGQIHILEATSFMAPTIQMTRRSRLFHQKWPF